MVVPALEHNAKSMSSVTHDGVDITAKIISEVAEILGKIELRFDFNPSNRQKERMQAEYFDEYLSARISLMKAGEEYVNSKEDLKFSQEDQKHDNQQYSEAIKNKSTSAEELNNFQGKSAASRAFYLEEREEYVKERDEYSQAKINYFQAASNYYESKVNPKHAWEKYVDKLHKSKEISPEIESLANLPDFDALNPEKLKQELDDFDARLSYLIEEKQESSTQKENQTSTETIVNKEESSNNINNVEVNSQTEIIEDPWFENAEISNRYKRNQVSVETNIHQGTNSNNFDVEVDPKTGLIQDPWIDIEQLESRNNTIKEQNSQEIKHQKYSETSTNTEDLKISDLIYDPEEDETLDYENSYQITNMELQNNIETDENYTPDVDYADVKVDFQQNQIIASGIEKFLLLEETNNYEANKYLFSKSDNEISITAGDERGEVFHVDKEGNIESYLDENETQEFIKFSTEVDDIVNKQIADGVEQFLSVQGTDIYRTNEYLFEKNNSGISISSNESGEKILQTSLEGNIESNLSIKETQMFLEFSKDVALTISNSEVEKQQEPDF
ncbi:MAG: hypothetical protein SWX82_30480 [Cyanobacteriota bacterium]|nr:hypothetical protein [Cyanobacteriota bacterium]